MSDDKAIAESGLAGQGNAVSVSSGQMIDSLSTLCDVIYAAPTEAQPWSTALAYLRQRLNAMHVTLILRPPTSNTVGGIFNTQSAAQQATQSYQSHFFALDPFVGLPLGQVLTPEELIGSSWRKSTLNRQYLRPLNVGHILGADIETDQGISVRLRISRSCQAAPFDEADKALCRFLLPHLQRSIQLSALLDGVQAERQLYAGTIDRMQLGVVLFAADGQILEVNAEAQRIFACHDGIWMRDGSLWADKLSDRREVRRLITAVTQQSPAVETAPGLVDAIAVRRGPGRSPLGLVMRSLEPANAWSQGLRRPIAALFIRDPEAQSLNASEQMLSRLYGMTPRQAELALCLADGLTIDDAAERMDVARNTVRTYMRSIYTKTGSHRQALVVRTLLRSVMSAA